MCVRSARWKIFSLPFSYYFDYDPSNITPDERSVNHNSSLALHSFIRIKNVQFHHIAAHDRGNYSEYVASKAEAVARQWAAYEKQQKEIARQVGLGVEFASCETRVQRHRVWRPELGYPCLTHGSTSPQTAGLHARNACTLALGHCLHPKTMTGDYYSPGSPMPDRTYLVPQCSMA